MQEYYLLFGLGAIWTIFAVVQDLKKREVANWLNFSLIAFALAYRAFYAAFFEEIRFFVFGLIGFVLFFVLAHLFYYARIFAGGDAKLLMGFGVILPYSTFEELGYGSILFILALFFFGAIYGLIYSIFIAIKNKTKFSREFIKNLFKNRLFLIIILILSIVFIFININQGIIFVFASIVLLSLYIYALSLEKCMIKLVNAKELQEGDWLEKNVRIGRRIIKKSVHGLSLEEIKSLKKNGKKVLIKEGIPFTPAFLFALVAMAPFFLVLRVSLQVFFLF